VKAVPVILGIILRLFIRRVGYSNLMLYIVYTVPRGSVVIIMLQLLVAEW
jgi:hypothetical protein